MKRKPSYRFFLFILALGIIIPGMALAETACDPALDGSQTNCESVEGLGVDLDGDGHDSIASGGDDCDDGDSNRYPGNVEVCDAVNKDEDCNYATFGNRDADGDGFIDDRCCNLSNCGNDCDDARRGTHPISVEVCDGLDNDCNGAIDDSGSGGSLQVLAFLDLDGDGWGDNGDAGISLCPSKLLSQGRSGVQGDCNDQTASIHPGALEACNGLDDNCNGVGDEGLNGACD